MTKEAATASDVVLACDQLIAMLTLRMSQDRMGRLEGRKIIDGLLDARCVASELVDEKVAA